MGKEIVMTIKEKCPFCACEDLTIEKSVFDCRTFFFVQCLRYGCKTSGPLDENKQKAVEKWNGRY